MPTDRTATSAQSCVVVPATTADLDAIAAIEQVAFSDPWSRAAFAAALQNPLVLFSVAHPVGCMPAPGSVLGYVVAWFAADESEIGNLAVAPSARGAGIGAALLDVVLEAAARRGAVSTYLEVRESNVAARRLYASRGFGPVGRRRRYYQHPAEDALVLHRPIAQPAATSDGNDPGKRA